MVHDAATPIKGAKHESKTKNYNLQIPYQAKTGPILPVPCNQLFDSEKHLCLFVRACMYIYIYIYIYYTTRSQVKHLIITELQYGQLILPRRDRSTLDKGLARYLQGRLRGR